VSRNEYALGEWNDYGCNYCNYIYGILLDNTRKHSFNNWNYCWCLYSDYQHSKRESDMNRDKELIGLVNEQREAFNREASEGERIYIHQKIVSYQKQKKDR
jgi:hypothetical protein